MAREPRLRFCLCCYPLVGIVALRCGKCVATGNEAARYCDDPRPTRRGLADPEKSVVTKAKIGHFVTPPADIFGISRGACGGICRKTYRFIHLSPRECGESSDKGLRKDKVTAQDKGLAAL